MIGSSRKGVYCIHQEGEELNIYGSQCGSVQSPIEKGRFSTMVGFDMVTGGPKKQGYLHYFVKVEFFYDNLRQCGGAKGKNHHRRRSSPAISEQNIFCPEIGGHLLATDFALWPMVC